MSLSLPPSPPPSLSLSRYQGTIPLCHPTNDCVREELSSVQLGHRCVCLSVRQLYYLCLSVGLHVCMYVRVCTHESPHLPVGYLENMVPIIALVFASEILVDWTKHAFITKFNDITPDVYQKYRAILSRDLATSRHKNVSHVTSCDIMWSQVLVMWHVVSGAGHVTSCGLRCWSCDTWSQVLVMWHHVVSGAGLWHMVSGAGHVIRGLRCWSCDVVWGAGHVTRGLKCWSCDTWSQVLVMWHHVVSGAGHVTRGLKCWSCDTWSQVLVMWHVVSSAGHVTRGLKCWSCDTWSQVLVMWHVVSGAGHVTRGLGCWSVACHLLEISYSCSSFLPYMYLSNNYIVPRAKP